MNSGTIDKITEDRRVKRRASPKTLPTRREIEKEERKLRKRSRLGEGVVQKVKYLRSRGIEKGQGVELRSVEVLLKLKSEKIEEVSGSEVKLVVDALDEVLSNENEIDRVSVGRMREFFYKVLKAIGSLRGTMLDEGERSIVVEVIVEGLMADRIQSSVAAKTRTKEIVQDLIDLAVKGLVDESGAKSIELYFLYLNGIGYFKGDPDRAREIGKTLREKGMLVGFSEKELVRYCRCCCTVVTQREVMKEYYDIAKALEAESSDHFLNSYFKEESDRKKLCDEFIIPLIMDKVRKSKEEVEGMTGLYLNKVVWAAEMVHKQEEVDCLVDKLLVELRGMVERKDIGDIGKVVGVLFRLVIGGRVSRRYYDDIAVEMVSIVKSNMEETMLFSGVVDMLSLLGERKLVSQDKLQLY